MRYIQLNCTVCGCAYKKSVSHYNRAIKDKSKLFCSQKCFGISRRDNKTLLQKKKEKADYDKKYRYYHIDGIKEKKALAFKIDYAANPEKYKAERKRRYKQHLEYLQTGKYKKWKYDYDQKRVAKKSYGIFWESSLLLKELESWLLAHAPEGIKFQMGITNKTQKRKRLWQKTRKSSPQRA